MAAVGCQLHADLTELAVMWFGRALANLHKFWDLAGRADRYFRHHRPDAVVLIDYPGFNWWIAWRAKIHGIPVFYYTPPQIWAWATWRAKKMRRLSDHVLCSLPFEEAWFRQRGCNATFVGHPFFDEVRQHKLDESFLARRSPPQRPAGDHSSRLANAGGAAQSSLVPQGRRPRAASGAGGPFRRGGLQTEARRDGPGDGRGKRAGSRERGAGSREREPSGHDSQPAIEIYSGRTPELMHLATCCMACSGSVSMELLYYTKPTVIHYWISPLAYAVQKRFRKVKYITLVNLLSTGELYPADLSPYDPSQPGAEKVLFPEYLTCEDKSAAVAGHVIQWLKDPAALARQIAALEQLKAEVAHGGASARAAEYILRELHVR